MTLRLNLNLPAALVLLAASLATAQAGAQTSADAPAPPAYRSALEGYQIYTDEKIVSWKEANDNAGRIGGWREYAKEASESQAPAAAAQPNSSAAPVKPAKEQP